MLKKILVIFSFFVSISFSQNNEILVTGDSLVGKITEGGVVREVYGHVILKHGDVTITCDKAIHYITKNDAELIGNVVAIQRNLTITTPKGFYYGNQKKAFSNSKIKLDDKKVILTAINGEYFFNEDRAYFYKDVKLYDTVTTMYSNEMTYYQKENRMKAYGKVSIIDKENLITADSVEYLKLKRVSIANSNVRLFNKQNNTYLYGDHVEDYGLNSYTFSDKNPLLIQIDTAYYKRIDTVNLKIDTTLAYKLDTLVIKSLKMQAYRDTINTFIATDSVEIARDNFSSKNRETIYYRKNDKIVTYKSDVKEPQPILWYENTQITGDSIVMYLDKNRLNKLDVKGFAFTISQNPIYKLRMDQISGDRIIVHLDSNRVNNTDVTGNVYSIYYSYDNEKPNGLIKSSSQRASIYFRNNQVNDVRLYGAPNTEYHPEVVVDGKEPSYTLPQFVLYNDKPVKENILKDYFNGKHNFKK